MRLPFIFLACLSLQAQIVITPTGGSAGVPPSVGVGASQTFTASGGTAPYTWSLASGSAGSIAGSTYTAPASIPSNNVVFGCQTQPTDAVWNVPIANGATDLAPVDARTTPVATSGINTWFTTSGTDTSVGIAMLPGFPPYLFDNSTPPTVLIQNEGGSNGNYHFPPFPYFTQEGGVFATIVNNDHHFFGLNRNNCNMEEGYQLYATGTISGGCNSGHAGCNVQSALQYQQDYTMPIGLGGFDAAGMHGMPLTLRYSEIAVCAAGGPPIHHALRVTMPNAYLADLPHSIVWPATANTSNWPGAIPYGERFRITSAWYTANISKFTNPAEKCIVTAMRNYGLFMADGGGMGQVTTMADVNADTTVAQALVNIYYGFTAGNIMFGSGGNFEAVDETGLIDPGQCPNGSGFNPSYSGGCSVHTNLNNILGITPSIYASVHVHDSAGTPLTADLPIILTPVTITDDSGGTNLVFQSGVGATTIPLNVHGTSNQAVTATISPATGAGTIANGTGQITYTPPSGVTSPVTATITITPAADATQSLVIQAITMAPTIREALNVPYFTTPVTDPSGNVWYNDAGAAHQRFDGFANGNCGSSGWPANSQLFQNFAYTNGNDTIYHFTLAPGNYQLSALEGQCNGGAIFPSATWMFGLDYGSPSSPMNYTAITNTPTAPTGASQFFGLSTNMMDECNIIGGCANKTPATFTQNFTIASSGLNNFYFAIRGNGPGTSSSLSAFSITPTGSLSPTGSVTSKGVSSGGVRHLN